MPENRIIDSDAAASAGRQLIDSALQRNPVVAIATALIVPLLSLFRRRSHTTASVEKMKLESYRYRPLESPAHDPRAPECHQLGRSMVAARSQEGFPSSDCNRCGSSPTSRSGRKGGRRHG